MSERPEGARDLMAELEASVSAAKEARRRARRGDDVTAPFPIPEAYDEIDAIAKSDGVNLCWHHYMVEPWNPGVYRVCGECGHVFATGAELLDAHNAVLAKIDSPSTTETNPDAVWYCPHCVHDF